MTNAVQLFRIDPAHNLRRFYRLDIQPDLFGGVSLVKEWGRMGRGGQVRIVHHVSDVAACDALETHKKSKIERGYKMQGITYDQ